MGLLDPFLIPIVRPRRRMKVNDCKPMKFDKKIVEYCDQNMSNFIRFDKNFFVLFDFEILVLKFFEQDTFNFIMRFQSLFYISISEIHNPCTIKSLKLFEKIIWNR